MDHFRSGSENCSGEQGKNSDLVATTVLCDMMIAE